MVSGGFGCGSTEGIGEAVFRRRAGKDLLGLWPYQAGQADGRNAKGCTIPDPEQGGRDVWLKHPLHELRGSG